MQLFDACPSEDSAKLRPRLSLRTGIRTESFFTNAGRLTHGIRLRFNPWSLLTLGVIAAGLTCGTAVTYYVRFRATALPQTSKESAYWGRISHVDLKNLATVGKNPYFNLEPGYRLRYTNGEATRTITVRRTTKVIEGVETRVIEQKEKQHGQPTKIVWKYCAIDKTSGALFCFGVHIQTYCRGSLMSNHGWRWGAWSDVHAGPACRSASRRHAAS